MCDVSVGSIMSACMFVMLVGVSCLRPPVDGGGGEVRGNDGVPALLGADVLGEVEPVARALDVGDELGLDVDEVGDGANEERLGARRALGRAPRAAAVLWRGRGRRRGRGRVWRGGAGRGVEDEVVEVLALGERRDDGQEAVVAGVACVRAWLRARHF